MTLTVTPHRRSPRATQPPHLRRGNRMKILMVRPTVLHPIRALQCAITPTHSTAEVDHFVHKSAQTVVIRGRPSLPHYLAPCVGTGETASLLMQAAVVATPAPFLHVAARVPAGVYHTAAVLRPLVCRLQNSIGEMTLDGGRTTRTVRVRPAQKLSQVGTSSCSALMQMWMKRGYRTCLWAWLDRQMCLLPPL